MTAVVMETFELAQHLRTAADAYRRDAAAFRGMAATAQAGGISVATVDSTSTTPDNIATALERQADRATAAAGAFESLGSVTYDEPRFILEPKESKAP